MKKIGIAIGVLLGLYLLPGLAALLLSGGGRDFILAKLSAAAGVEVRAKSVAFDFPAYLQFKPALGVEDVTVGSPAGFKSPHMLTAGKLRAQVKLFSLFGKEPHVTSVEIVKPTITVERNANGDTNIEAFLKSLSSGEKAKSEPASAAGGGLEVDRVAISQGELTLVGFPVVEGGPAVRQIDITVKDIAPSKAYNLEASALLYKGDRSQLKFAGSIGPSSPGKLPIDGIVTVKVAPDDIPVDVRKRDIGDFLSVPGSKSLVSVESKMKGDLYETLEGSAELVIADLFLGRDEKHKLAWSSKAPAVFRVQHALGTPDVTLEIRSGTAKAGSSGTWSGAFKVRSAKGILSGSSSGAIQGVDSNEFLSAFSTATDKISGVLAIPSYQFQFSGKDAAALKNSLSATGKIEVAKGRVSALNLLNSIESALSGKSPQGGATEFTTLKCNLEVSGQNARIENILIDGPGLDARGAGTITGANQALDFKLDVIVSGAIAGLIPGRAVSSGPPQATVPVSVTGTVDHPSVKPNVGKLAGDVAKKALGGFLDRALGKKP